MSMYVRHRALIYVGPDLNGDVMRISNLRVGCWGRVK